MTRFLFLTFSLSLIFGCIPNTPAPVYERSPSFDRHVPETYVVKVGDSLYSIAWRYQLDVNSIAEFNDVKPPYLLRPGDILVLSNARKEVSKAKGTLPNDVTNRPKPGLHRNNKSEGDLWSYPVETQPTEQFSKKNTGLDYMLPDGETIRASSSGVVVYAGSGLRGYISLVIIKHNQEWLSAYGMNVPYSVKEGDSVVMGEPIAIHEAGANSSRKFHFEVRRNGKPVDPMALLSIKVPSS